jgi:hypothetical protein
MRVRLGVQTRHHVKTVAATSSSQPNSETLDVREVLVHPRKVFHPCMCELRGGATVIATTLIGYDDMKVAVRMTTMRRP